MLLTKRDSFAGCFAARAKVDIEALMRKMRLRLIFRLATNFSALKLNLLQKH